MKSCSAFDNEIQRKFKVHGKTSNNVILEKNPKSCINFQSWDRKEQLSARGCCSTGVSVSYQSLLKLLGNHCGLKTNRLQENANPATYLGFQNSKERLHFHLVLQTPFALFSNIFNSARKRVLFIQISSLLTSVNIIWEYSKNSLKFSWCELNITPKSHCRDCRGINLGTWLSIKDTTYT